MLRQTFVLGNPRLIQTIAATFHLVALSWSLECCVAPPFAYMGYPSLALDTSQGLMAVTGFVILASLMPSGVSQPSEIFVWIFLLFVVAPIVVVASSVSAIGTAAPLSNFTASVFVGQAILIASLRIRRYPFRPPVAVTEASIWLFMTTAAGLLVLIVLVAVRFRLRFAGISEVYDVRLSFRETLQGSPAYLGYALGWLAGFFFPAIFAHGVSRRTWSWSIIGASGGIFLYSVNAQKTFLLSSVLIAGVAILMQKQRTFGTNLCFATTFVVTLATVADILSESIIWTSLFSRRLFLTAGLNSVYYVDYYSREGWLYLRHNLLVRPFLGGTTAPSRQVGAYYYNEETAANANFAAEAFANFGSFGVIFFAVALGLILWLLDSVTKQSDKVFVSIGVSLSALSLSNSALFTSLLTHGILFWIVLAAVLPPGRRLEGVSPTRVRGDNERSIDGVALCDQ